MKSFFKNTVIFMCMSAAFSAHAEPAIPDRPSIPHQTQIIPPPPVYVQPELAAVPEAPGVVTAPIYPTEPTKNWTYMDPPTKFITPPSLSILRGGRWGGVSSLMYFDSTKEEALAAIESAKALLPFFGRTDFMHYREASSSVYRVKSTDDFDKFMRNEDGTLNTVTVQNLAGGLVPTVALQIDQASNEYTPLTRETIERLQDVVAGRGTIVDGQRYDAIYIHGTGLTVTAGAWYKNGSSWDLAGNGSELPLIDSGYETQLIAIDEAAPTFPAYQDYVDQHSEAIVAYNAASAAYPALLEQYYIQSAEYAEYLDAYSAWQSTSAQISAQNSELIQQSLAAHGIAVAAYEGQMLEHLATAVAAIPGLTGMGGGYAPGTDAAAFGPAAIAAGDRSTAMGVDAFAVGVSSTAMGDNAVAVGDNSVAVGANSVAFNDNAIAIGSGALAVGGVAIGAGAISETDISIAIGAGARAVSSVAVGVGSQALGLNTTAIGDWSSAVGDTSVAIGANSAAIGANSVAIGAGTVATRANSVSVGGRVITDVAAPVDDSDAATKGYVDAQVAAVAAPDLAPLESRVDALDSKVDRLDRKIDKVEKRAAAGTAIALALQTPAALLPGERAIGAGVGTYGGQQAIAVSYAQNIMLDNKKRWYKEVTVSAGIGAATTGGVGARAGVAFKF